MFSSGDLAEMFASELKASEAPSIDQLLLQAEEDEQRTEKRYLVQWRAVIISNVHSSVSTFWGRTVDVSMSGASILVENNIYFEKGAILLLSIPPAHIYDVQKIVEIEVDHLYTVLPCDGEFFRAGFKFKKFNKGSIDQLSSRLIVSGGL